jgi:tetratricopeptide (TPR) repeat protein
MTSPDRNQENPGAPICQICRSALAQVGKFWVCPICGPVSETHSPSSGSPEESPASQSVFISYGRSDGASFADRLMNDLKEHGNLVFLDTISIAKGGRFDADIERGISNSTVFAAVLTPYSVRPDSVCRDETVYAHNANKQIVPLKAFEPQLPVPLLLVRRNWIDFSSSYEQGLKDLLSFLRGDEKVLQRPTFATVTGIVPIDFAPEIARFSAGFTGREWLLNRIAQWLATSSHRALVFLAEPGFGKSAIAAWISQRWPFVAGIHFCTKTNSRTRDPQEFVANLVGQLNETLKGFSDAVLARFPERPRKTAGDAFRELIVEVTSALPSPDQPYLIVIDSLDEAVIQRPEGETILDVLVEQAAYLPPWLRIVATSRAEEGVLARIRDLDHIELECDQLENREDIRKYIGARLANNPSKVDNLESATAQLEALAAGNFLIAKMALDAIDDNVMSPEDLSRLAPGLVSFFQGMFRGRFPDVAAFQQQYAPLLRALVAARAPLPFPLLHQIAGGSAEGVADLLDDLRSCLRVSGLGEESRYSIFHRSLSDWLASHESAGRYWCRLHGGHEALAGAGWKLYESDRLRGDDYFARYLGEHLLGADQKSRLLQLLADLNLLNAAYEQHRSHEWMRLWRTLLEEVDPVQTYRAAIDRLKTAAPPGPDLALAADRIGALLRDLGLFSEAVEFSAEAVAAWEAVAGAQAPGKIPAIAAGGHAGTMAVRDRLAAESPSNALAQALRDHAEALRLIGSFDKAFPCYERALEIWKELHTEESAEVATIYHDLAEFYRDKGDIPTAIEWNKRSGAVREGLVPPDYAAIADCTNDTGVMLWESAGAAAALEYYERALELFQKAYPSGEHYDIATVLSNIADYKQASDPAGSVREQERALKMALLFRPFHYPHCRSIRSHLVSSLVHIGEFEKAATYQRDSVRCADVLASREKSDKDKTVALVNRLAERQLLYHLLTKGEKAAEARAVHREVSALMVDFKSSLEAFSDQGWDLDRLGLRDLAFKFFQSRDYSNAESVLRLMADHKLELPGTLVHLARVLLLQDREAEAREVIAQAVPMRKEGNQPYAEQRVLFLQFLVALTTGEPAGDHLEALVSYLESSEIFMFWDTSSLLDHIGPRLSESDRQTLATLSLAINDLGKRTTLRNDLGLAETSNESQAVDGRAVDGI